MCLGELGERGDRPGRGLDVGVRGDDVRRLGRGRALVDVRAEAECADVLEDARLARGRGRAAGVLDEDELADLRCERLEAFARVGVARGPDDDGRDVVGQSSSR
jgi:hypothetical protein